MNVLDKHSPQRATCLAQGAGDNAAGPHFLEICAATIAGAEAAWRGGADRIELCASLETGGLTPSVGLIRAARALDAKPLHVLIRGRAGDFCYTEAEQRVMLDDCCRAADEGADGVVVGALAPDGSLDCGFLRACREAVPQLALTLHRAFDFCRDPFRALEQAIDCGCQYILSSGQAATAEAGMDLLRNLQEKAQGRIEIMPGCGVGPQNARRILSATGCRYIHASAKAPHESAMTFRLRQTHTGLADFDEYSWSDTSEQTVRLLAEEVRGARCASRRL